MKIFILYKKFNPRLRRHLHHHYLRQSRPIRCHGHDYHDGSHNW